MARLAEQQLYVQRQMFEQQRYSFQAQMLAQNPSYYPYGYGYPQRQFHLMWFLLVGWWLGFGLASMVWPLGLLVFGWGRKVWAGILGYW